MSEAESGTELVLELAEEFLARYRRGERPSLKEYADRHPELASEIRNVFPAMAMMENIAVVDESSEEATIDDAAKPATVSFRQLGDYRIIREIGRGGMGHVFEAEQVSLGRHVALKLLPNHALQDDKQKRRFAREAKAAAKLHHTNIVPVFGVGEHDGVPYYMMQFIQGLVLDAVLEELRRLQPTDAPAPTALGEAGELRVARRDVSAVDMARSLITGTFDETADVAESPDRNPSPVLEATLDLPVDDGVNTNGAIQDVSDSGRLSDSFTISSSSISLPESSSSARSGRKKQTYWHSVASIGRQVADALEYAHKQGIQHRDVKPSNLLLDLRGTVWVADFGLAKVAGPDMDDLTHTGDLLGTLRYMPPERFEGKSDVRSDVYSLGLTLYELLAMQPAFVERDRNKLVKQMTTTEPPRLDKVRKGIPRDLVTIVQKAIERDPPRRYATSEEFAADLQRFLDDEPIQARRQTQLERCVRWARHHPGIASLGGVLAGVLVLVTAASLLTAGYLNQLRVKESLAAKSEREARGDALQARNAAALQAAGLLLDRGIEDAQQGEPARALHLFVRALRTLAVDAPDAANLERAIRLNLTAWGETVPALEQIWPGTKRISMIVLSPDGALAALAISDLEVQVFRTADGRPVGPPIKLADGVGRIEFAADGRSLWVVSRNHDSGDAKSETIRRVDVASGAVLGHTIATETGPVEYMVATPDGKRLVAAVSSLHPNDSGPSANALRTRWWRTGSIMVWNTANGQVVRKVEINAENWLGYLGLSSDAQTVVFWANRIPLINGEPVASKDPAQTTEPPFDGLTFRIDGTEPPVRLGRLPYRSPNDNGVVFLPGMNRGLIVEDGLIHRWSMAAPGRLAPGVSSQIRYISSPSPDGRTVVSRMNGRLYDVGAWPPRPTGERFAHPAWFPPWANVEWTSDGRFAATGVQERLQTRLWRIPRSMSRPPLPEVERDRQSSQPAPYDQAEFDDTGARAVLSVWADGTPQRQVQVVDFAAGQVRQAAGHSGVRVLDVAFSPDGRYFALGDRNGQARVWDAATGRPAGPPLQHSNWVAAVAFSPDGQTLAAGDFGPAGLVKLWDWRTGKERRPPLQHDDIILGVAFSPDGTRLASFTTRDWVKNPRVWLWDLESGTTTGQAPYPYPLLSKIGPTPFRPDGQVVMARDDDGLLRLWEVPTARVRAERRLDGRGVNLFSRDGKVVAAAEPRGVRLLDGDTLAPLAGGLLSFAPDLVNAIAFSPDGAFLFTGHESGSAQLWDVASRKPVGPPTVLIGPIRSVAFSADGKTCQCVAADGAARRWKVPAPFEESSFERLDDRVALMTGLRIDDAHGLDFIDAEEWKSLRASLVGDDSTTLTPPRADVDWHDRRAADAEQDGDVFGAAWHLDRLAALRKDDWTIPARRGRVLASAGRREEAAAAYSAARGLVKSPQALADWLRVAASHDEASGRKATAIWAMNLAIALTPDDWTLYSMRSQWTDKTSALADLDEAVRRGGDDAIVYRAANQAAEAGDWKRSAAWLNRVAKAAATPPQSRYIQALANLKAGDRAGYKLACGAIAKQVRSGDSKMSLNDANNAAMAFALGPNATDDWSQPLGWLDRALARLDAAAKSNPGDQETIRRIRHTFMNTRGAVLYRAGRYEEAAKSLREGMNLNSAGGVLHDWLFLALAEHRLGSVSPAKEAADKARAMIGANVRSIWEKAEVEALSAELDAVLPRAPK